MSGKFKIVGAAAVLIAVALSARSWGEDSPTLVPSAIQASPSDVVPAPPGPSDAAPGPAQSDTAPVPAPSVTVLGSKQAQGVLGKEVRSTANENMGRIIDVIVDRAGQVRAAVIDFGGFLGVGSRKIAVDWNALQFSPESTKRDVITLNLTRDQVKGAPEYKDRRAVIVLGAAGALSPLPDE